MSKLQYVIYKTRILLTLSSFFLCTCVFPQLPAIEWQKNIGGSLREGRNDGFKTSDGGFLFIGRSNSNISGDKSQDSFGDFDYWIVKTDGEGNVSWDKTFGGTNTEWARGGIESVDGGYIIGGVSLSDVSGNKTDPTNGALDMWLIKIDENGNLIWDNSIGGLLNDSFRDIIHASDGGYIIAGSSRSDISGDKTENNMGFGGTDDCWILKINELGEILWQQTIGGNTSDRAMSILQTSDGGYIIAGSSRSDASGDKSENSYGGIDRWIIKLNILGEIEWEKTYGGDDSDWHGKIRQLENGAYLVAGHSDSNASGNKDEDNVGGRDWWIFQIDSNGEIEWQNTIGGDSLEQVSSFIIEPDGYLISGYSRSTISGDMTETVIGDSDIWIVKLDLLGNILWQQRFGGENRDVGVINKLDDGSYVILGTTTSNESGDILDENNGEFDYFIMKFSNPDSLFENLVESEVSIYPNPSNDKFIIDYEDQVVVKLLNSLGKIVIQTDNNIINVSDLSPGIYILMVYDAKGDLISINKVVKE